MTLEYGTKQASATAPDLALIRAAYGLAATPAMRDRLAALLFQAGEIDEVIALLADGTNLAAREEQLLASAWLRKESPASQEQALAALGRALALSARPDQRSAILTRRARIEQEQGNAEAAEATLVEALLLDPHNIPAGKQLATMMLGDGRAQPLLGLVDELIARGGGHAWLFAGYALAQVRLGNLDAARRMLGGEDLRYVGRLGPPGGWEDIAVFNRALASQLAGHSGLRRRRYGSEGEYSSRIDAPLTPDAPLVRLLLQQIAEAVHLHLERVDRSDHPWARVRPREAILSSSCVITDDVGFEAWHIHPFAWLSGAYYVAVPDAVATGADEAGCIAFGLPEKLAGAEAAANFGREIVRPQDGLLLMFPSHLHHRTFPHGLSERRICFTFDVRPTS